MIIDSVPSSALSTLQSIRLVSRAFNRRGRAALFRVLVVSEHRLWATGEGGEASLVKFLESREEVREAVREVVFKLSG